MLISSNTWSLDTISVMMIFDGLSLAQAREQKLKPKVEALISQGKKLKIAAILFVEDPGSVLYTALKKETAERLGITYQVFEFSLRDPVELITDQIKALGQDQSVTGIIVQKPTRKLWESVKNSELEFGDRSLEFNHWWQSLVVKIDESKDVDGLNPRTLELIKAGTWAEQGRVLPATARAVLTILKAAQVFGKKLKFIILGKSDLLGRPLSYELKNGGEQVGVLGTKGLNQRKESGQLLLDADVIISATGQPGLITGEMIKDGVVVIDAGEPKGDVDFTSVAPQTSFITPVPGGVGPLTVISLMENCADLI